MRQAQRRFNMVLPKLSRRHLLAGALAPFSASLVAAPVTLDRFPYLQDVGSDHAVIMWTTRQKGIGSVNFSSDLGFARQAPATVREFLPAETGRPFPFYQYLARLTGLREGIQYFYRVLVDGQNLTPAPSPSEELRLRTAARGPVNFLAFADSGEGRAEQSQLAALMAREDISLVLHGGDIVYPDGSYQNYEAYFFAVYRDMMSRVPIFTVPGNHDYYVDSAAPYLASTSAPAADLPPIERGRFYSFDWGDIHFIALDTNEPLDRATNGSGGVMLKWLEQDLQNSRKFWRIAFFHHAPYPTSQHHENDEVSALVREQVVPILERHGVPLVISGHDHNYQRTFLMRNGAPVTSGIGTEYIITGGGGAGLFPLPVPASPLVAKGATAYHYLRATVEGSKATLQAISLDGREIDRAVLVPPPELFNNAVVNAASYAAAIAPGSLVSIYGRSLAFREEQAGAFPLPPDLLGVQVSINGQPMPLTYVGPNQINAQLPFSLSGNATLVVTTANGSASTTVNIADIAPGIFFGGAPAVTHNGDGRLVTSGSPAAPGEFLSIFLTGLGRVDGSISAGQAAPAAPLFKVAAPVEVRLGNTTLTPVFAGLAPGYAGLYQVVIQLPATIRNGTFSLQITSRGAVSNTVSIPVLS